MAKLVQQMARFGVVGIIAFAIDYGIMFILTEFLSINYLVSATVGFVVSVTFNYSATMRYVFSRKKGTGRARELSIFVGLSVVGLGLNDLMMWFGQGVLGISYLVVKFIATAVVTAWNFVTRKAFLDDTGGVADDIE